MADNNQQECTHDCDSCGSDCGSCGSDCGSDCGSNEGGQAVDMKAKLNDGSSVKKVIGIISGKGGVGKSLVTALSAIQANRNGYKVGIMDADITGPSIPKMFGLHKKAEGTEFGLLPVATPTEIEVMSLNLLTENETDPVDRKSTRLNSSH